MRKSGNTTTAHERKGNKRAEDSKASTKRKRMEDAPQTPKKDTQLNGDDRHDEGNRRPTETGQTGRQYEHELADLHPNDKVGSETVMVSIRHIRQKMEFFTQQVSGLLETGKGFFMDAATAFEERILELHEKQMEKWEQEVEELREVDAANEDMNFRLSNARDTINLVRPTPPSQA